MENTRLRSRSARTDDGELAAPAAGDPPVRDRPTGEPSWHRVYLTTGRVFLERKLRLRLHRADRSRPPLPRPPLPHPSRRARQAGAGVGVLLLIGAGGFLLGRTTSPSPPAPAAPDPVLLAAAVRDQTAAWVATEVGQDHHIACDPASCAELDAAGFPTGGLVPLPQPGTAPPPAPRGKTAAASKPANPLAGADLILVTPQVREQHPDTLATGMCPQVLAAFGAGAQRIELHALASPSTGVAGCQTALAGDRAGRAKAGGQLVVNPGLSVSPAAADQLNSGAVDARLISVLTAYAANHQLLISGFSLTGPGASADVPLRQVRVGGVDGHPPAMSDQATSALTAFLWSQRAPLRPNTVTLDATETGQDLVITYTAPSPLGLLGTG